MNGFFYVLLYGIMAFVQILHPSVIQFIAAGEIIENMASIVKELLENSIDSEANTIKLKINYDENDMTIIIEDDGSGIDPEDLPLIFLQHATSKSSDILSIVNINTLGFRGEALWSIANIAKVEIVSNYQNNSYEIIGSYSHISPVKHLGNTDTKGTIIKVSGIFKNLPVRKKFLKSWDEEYKNIFEVFKQEAFIYYNKTFILEKNQEIITYPSTNPISRMESFSKFWQHNIYHQYEENNYKGMILASWQWKGKFFLSVNNRIIMDYKIKKFLKNLIEKKINEPIKDLSGGLYLFLPQEDIDINIHPRKQEVKFKDGSLLYSLLKNLIDDYFSEKPIKPVKEYQYSVVSEKKYNLSNNGYNNNKIMAVHDNFIANDGNYKNINVFNHNLFIVKKDKQIIMIDKNQLFRNNKNLLSKIITLPLELVNSNIFWHQYDVKFSIVSPTSILVWHIPQSYPGDITSFFEEVLIQWNNNSLNNWLNNFNPWCEDNIIDYINKNKIDNNWPLNYCSWIIEE